MLLLFFLNYANNDVCICIYVRKYIGIYCIENCSTYPICSIFKFLVSFELKMEKILREMLLRFCLATLLLLLLLAAYYISWNDVVNCVKTNHVCKYGYSFWWQTFSIHVSIIENSNESDIASPSFVLIIRIRFSQWIVT